MAHSLELRNLQVEVDGNPILKGLSLRLNSGDLHVIMGPNGSGKSTLSQVVMGHPKYKITSGDVLFDGQSILTLTPDKRAKLGLFLGFQYPRELPGVTYGQFLRLAKNAVLSGQGSEVKPLSPTQFLAAVKKPLALLGMKSEILSRSVNEGFSGGEKKRAEMLQMAVLEPSLAILDEIDSGLDVDVLKVVAQGIETVRREQGTGVLLITHYQQLFQFVKPNQVSIMVDGKIVKTGGAELVKEVEAKGYVPYQK